MKTYINAKYEDGTAETVDEFDTRGEAMQNLAEYKEAFHGIQVYPSTRCTNEWRDRA